jgi:transcriptional regulator with XRE-family HTH domain
MTVSVRVRNLPDLVARLSAYGMQAAVARRANISRSRLNQLVRGTRATLSVELAARVEDVLDVPRGTLFTFGDCPLVAPYAAHQRDAA